MKIDENQILKFSTKFKEIEDEIRNTIVGQQNIIRNVITVMIAGGNILLEGLPGLGKTQLVKAVGTTVDLKFSRIQFTPDLMPADVTGTSIMIRKDGGSSNFEFQKGPIFSNIVLADEINRATPKTQSALLEAMQERTVTVGANTYELPEPFFVLATQNPLEMEGTYPLPEAQMDRFMFKLNVGFPNKEELIQILDITTGNCEKQLSKVCDGNTILSMREVAKHVPVAKSVAEYAIDIILRGHPENNEAPNEVKKYVRYGSSPRGAQAIISAAKVYALMKGRYNVSYEDIKEATFPSLRHRLFLNFEATADGINSDDIIKIIIDEGK